MVKQISKQAIANSFSDAANSYDEAAFFQKIAGERLLERLDFFKLAPTKILDLGCGTGHFSRQISKRYSEAEVTGADIAQGMIDFCRSQSSKEQYICADACQLPFADNHFDFIFSNLTIQWIEGLDQLFKELNRVLKPGGLLLFTSLGPDTLFELKQSWRQLDNYQHVNDFFDMHHLGDAMLNAQMMDPVVDSEPVVLAYDKVIELMRDLKNIGAHNLNQQRNPGLTGAGKIQRLSKAYQQFQLDNGQLPATYELIYGHAFGSEQQVAVGYHEYALSLESDSLS